MNKDMKIKLYQCAQEKNALSQYPLGLGYLKTNCNAKIEIITDKKDLKGCDIIGLSANAWGVKEAIDILNSTKIPVIIGGQGTLWKGLQKYNFKHIVIGEGETALNRIIEGIDQKVVIMPLIQDIDNLKYPDRGKCKKRVPIFTVRGCPYNCYFCSSHKFWKKARYHSAEYFINEVLYIMEQYQERQLAIFDDLFIADKERFYKIYDLWMSKGLNKKFLLTGFVRSNLLTLNIAKKMKEMGFKSIRFGAESGSDKILKLLNKCATVEDNQRAIDIANSIKIPIAISFMYDLPNETKEDKKLTQQFIEKNKDKCKIGCGYKFRAFPGTKYYKGEDLTKVDMRVR